MDVSLHAASVPVFLRYLERLDHLVEAAQAFAGHAPEAAEALLDARLAPDMLPFKSQVVIAANFSLRACFPLAGRPVPPDGHFGDSFEGLRRHVEQTAALLNSLKAEEFACADEVELQSRAGDTEVSLAPPDFLLHYALPNFFFHLTAAYAILRSRGVPLGKEDFDGIHAYPPAGPRPEEGAR